MRTGLESLTQGPPGPELLPIFVTPPPQNLHPFPRGMIPISDLNLVSTQRAPIIVVPPHLNQSPRIGIMVQHRKGTNRPDANALVPTRMGGHSNSAEDLISPRCFELERRGCSETVNEQRGAAFAVGVGKEMEHLQAARVGEVGRVGVGAEGEGGIGGVFGGQVGCEIPEASCAR